MQGHNNDTILMARFLERVSNIEFIQKKIAHQNFTDDIIIKSQFLTLERFSHREYDRVLPQTNNWRFKCVRRGDRWLP